MARPPPSAGPLSPGTFKYSVSHWKRSRYSPATRKAFIISAQVIELRMIAIAAPASRDSILVSAFGLLISGPSCNQIFWIVTVTLGTGPIVR